MNTCKILITGSNGLLGQKLVYTLLEKYPGTSFVATSSGYNRISRKNGYIYESLDITNAGQVESIISRYKPEAVINTAAMTNVDACELNRDQCHKINVEGVINLINALENISTEVYKPHIVHLSTDFVFDGKNGPYREDDEPNPLSYYALSKLESEQALQNSSLGWSVLRTIIVYGVTDNMSRSNIVLWAKNALENGEEIKVINDQYRAPTLAEDLAGACIRAALGKARGIYHVAGKDMGTILQFVEIVADFYGLDKKLIRPVTSEMLNQPAKRPPRTGFILEKAEKELDYHPHSFREGLEIISTQLKNRAG